MARSQQIHTGRLNEEELADRIYLLSEKFVRFHQLGWLDVGDIKLPEGYVSVLEAYSQ